jgi:hypothetical protein
MEVLKVIKAIQYGCKKCGAVIKIDPKIRADKVEIRTTDALVRDHSGSIEIQCKKCRKPVAKVDISQM